MMILKVRESKALKITYSWHELVVQDAQNGTCTILDDPQFMNYIFRKLEGSTTDEK